MKNYRSSEEIFQSIMKADKDSSNGLNGFILLLHIGTNPERTDKFYYRLAELMDHLKKNGYTFVTVDELLKGVNSK